MPPTHLKAMRERLYRTKRGRGIYDCRHLLARLRAVHGRQGRADLAVLDEGDSVPLIIHPEPATLFRASSIA